MRKLILGFLYLFCEVNSDPITGSALYNYYPSIRTRKLSSGTLSSLSSIPSRSPTYNTDYPTSVDNSQNSKKVEFNAENIFLLVLLTILSVTAIVSFLYCCWLYVFCRCEKDRCFS